MGKFSPKRLTTLQQILWSTQLFLNSSAVTNSTLLRKNAAVDFTPPFEIGGYRTVRLGYCGNNVLKYKKLTHEGNLEYRSLDLFTCDNSDMYTIFCLHVLTMIHTVGTVLICLLIQTHAQLPTIFTGPRIVGGIKVDNRSYFSYQASIKYRDNHFCGGAILDKRHVLTATHCCFDKNGDLYKAKHLSIVVGDLNLFTSTSHTVSKSVKNVFIHSEYDPQTVENDIAIMRIKGDFGEWNSMMNAIALAPTLPPPTTQCVVSGWGLLQESENKASPDLYFATVPILEQATCKKAYRPAGIKNGMFCAGFLSGNVDACQGDSGGPLVCDDLLTGIVSWGQGCARPGKPGVYTDVSKYSEWIKEQVEGGAAGISPASPFIIVTVTVLHLFTLM